MERIPEPELMEDEEQAVAYAQADFDEPNRLFLELFINRFSDWTPHGTILDLGCGPGDICLRLARALPACRIDGLDGSAAMLEQASKLLTGTGLDSRVRFIHGRLPGASLPQPRYQAVTSNSLLHHLHQPQVLWEAILDVAEPGAPVLVMDLARPASEAQAREIVETYAADEAPVLKEDFHNSLLAAFEPGEVKAQLREAGLEGLEIERVSDRHLAAFGRIPSS